MASEFDHLRELYDERWSAHRREMELRAQALELAATDIDRRLLGMNEFRAQIEKERGAYLTRDMYDREHGVLEKRVSLLENAKSGMSGIWQAVAFVVTLLGIAALYFKH